MIKETHIFTGVMDQDSEARLVDPVDYRDLLDGENDARIRRGVVKKVKSNVLIGNPYLQNGENIVIGSRENLTNNSSVYCVYNENGFHSIFQYFRNKSGYPTGKIEKLIQPKYPQFYDSFHENPLNFSRDPDHLVTGINLVDRFLLITDNNSRSKLIDIERANESGKRRVFNIIFNAVNFGTPSTYTINLYKTGNAIPVTVFTWFSAGTDYVTRVKNFYDAFRQSGITTFNVISCGEHAQVQLVQEGEFLVWITEVNANITNASVSVPANFYPDKDLSLPVGYNYMSRDLFDELCYTSLCCPLVTYATDPARKINLVKNRLFQFCVRYQFLDNSWGVYGSRSKIALPVKSCGDENNFGNTNNYLLVDFTDARLTDPALVSVIQRVELAVNEPAKDEVWKTVKIFEQHEIAGPQQAKFKFYNDGNYPAIAPTLITRQFDSLFIKHKSKEFAADRQIVGGGTEGYDGPCSNAKLLLSYQQPDVVSGRYNVNLRLGIQPFLYTGSNANGQPFAQQPVIKMDPTIGSQNWGSCFRFNGNTEAQLGSTANYFQGMPSTGFIAYLAGTPYYGVSKQVIPAADLQIDPALPALQTDPVTGAILFNGSIDWRRQLWRLLDQYASNNTIIPQEITIPNVPNGRYLIRLASHLTSPNDLATSLDYQRTSTNGFVFNAGIVDTFEQEIIVNNGNVTGLDWIVHDLVDPSLATSAIMAYVVADDNPLFDPAVVVDYMNETRIEYARLQVSDDSGGFFTPVQHADHNGYLWASNRSIGGNNFTVNLIFSGRYNIAPSASINIETGAAWAGVPNGFGQIGAFRSTSTDIKNDGRTVLKGTVLNAVTGIGQPNVNVVNTMGSVYRPGQGTDINGGYAIITYPRVVSALALFAPRNGAVIFSAGSGLCQFTFDTDKVVYGPASADIQISPTSPPDYKWGTLGTGDPNFWYPVQDVHVTIVVLEQAKSAFKRGGDFAFGRIYKDEGARRCSVVTSRSEKLHIAFYTEAINGVIPPAGLPVIDWEVYNDPPDWAVSWNWVVTYNLQLNNYLQWCANKIEYVDNNDAATTPGNAILVKINLDNIGFYTVTKHPDAVINYTFVKGDRVRLIKDQNGVLYTDYYDFEIVKAIGTDIYIYPLAALSGLTAGVFLEIYTPKGINANNLYYEFGECYEVKSAIFNGVLRKYHAGPVQDQSYGPNPLQTVSPAKGRFTTGDVYYRLRSIPINVPGSPPYVANYAEKLMPIDDASLSDFYASKAPGFGQVNVESPEIGEVDSKDVLRISNLYIPGIKTNGFRNYEAGDTKKLKYNPGLINMLQMNGNVLNAMCANSATFSMYIDKSVLRQATGAVVVAIADEVINNSEKYQRSFGTVDPGSVQLNDEGDAWFWDGRTSIVSRSSGNGLQPVSDYKMSSRFRAIGQLRRNLQYKNGKVASVYHKDRDLYIISFNAIVPSEGVKPFVKFRAPWLDPALVYTFNPMIQVKVMPLNIDLVNALSTDPNFPDSGKIITTIVNAGTGTNGWTASLDKEGYVTITAPLASDVYSNNEIYIRINFVQGSNQFAEYSYNLSQAVLPSISDQVYPGETFAFCKDKQGWVQRYSFVPEYYGKIKGEVLQFRNGDLWLHEGGADYNNYFGLQFSRILDFIAAGTKDVIAIKQFKGIEVNAKEEHFCPVITTPADQKYPAGMKTQLRKNNFKLIKGKFYSDILRDEGSPGFPNANSAILDGRPMEGQSLEVRLVNDSVNPADLLECQVLYIYNEIK